MFFVNPLSRYPVIQLSVPLGYFSGPSLRFLQPPGLTLVLEAVVTRTYFVLFSVMVVATIVSLVWLPAGVGFGSAVGLAGLWTRWITEPRDAHR